MIVFQALTAVRFYTDATLHLCLKQVNINRQLVSTHYSQKLFVTHKLISLLVPWKQLLRRKRKFHGIDHSLVEYRIILIVKDWCELTELNKCFESGRPECKRCTSRLHSRNTYKCMRHPDQVLQETNEPGQSSDNEDSSADNTSMYDDSGIVQEFKNIIPFMIFQGLIAYSRMASRKNEEIIHQIHFGTA